ncbi:MAG TPA: hypothetical protein VGN52_22860 [Burkholderiales bacterium]
MPLPAARAQKAPPPPAAPAGYVFLAHGGPLCGEGHNYFVARDHYKPQELDWGRQTFGYIYHYHKGLDYSFILEYIADFPLSEAQADALFKSAPYLDWLGERGQAAMRQLREARAAYLAHAAGIDAQHKGKPAGAEKLPEVVAFRQARRAARTWLIDKLELQAKADKTAC